MAMWLVLIQYTYGCDPVHDGGIIKEDDLTWLETYITSHTRFVVAELAHTA